MINKTSGSITIFLSLMMVVLISFICTALYSARMAGSRYLFMLASEAAARSVFGAYDTEVWEQYRVLMLTDRELARQIGRECADYYSKNGTLFSSKVQSVTLSQGRTLAENGAAGWEEAAVSYMEVCLPVETISWLLGRADLLEGLDDIMVWIRGFKDLLKPLIRLEKRLCELEEQLSAAVEAYDQGKEILAEFQSCCLLGSQAAAAMRAALEDADETTGGADTDGGNDADAVAAARRDWERAWAELEQSYEAIRSYAGDSMTHLERLTALSARELSSVTALMGQVGTLLEDLGSSDTMGVTSLADLGGYIRSLGERLTFLEELPGELTKLQGFLSRLSQISLPSGEEILEDAADSLLQSILDELAGLMGNDWEMDVPEPVMGTEVDEENINLLLRLKEWLDQGILTLVLEEGAQVSAASLSRRLPRSERDGEDGLTDALYRNLLYGEYALRYTDQYGEGGGAGLRYETEYLIAGGLEDRANLAAVASRLLLIRGALNFVYLMQNQTANQQLQWMASGISAALGGWIPPGLITVILMVVWGMAEAVCDVRGLLAGEKIPLWKDQKSWHLDFSGLWSLMDQEFYTRKGSEGGMDYEAYLRLLLFAVPREEKCYRTMEIAEENLAAERDGFRIDQSWYRAMVTVKGQIEGAENTMILEYGY